MLVRTCSGVDLGEGPLAFPIADHQEATHPYLRLFNNARDQCLARCSVVVEGFSAFESL
jgi:hypothetical protein